MQNIYSQFLRKNEAVVGKYRTKARLNPGGKLSKRETCPLPVTYLYNRLDVPAFPNLRPVMFHSFLGWFHSLYIILFNKCLVALITNTLMSQLSPCFILQLNTMISHNFLAPYDLLWVAMALILLPILKHVS